MVSSTQSRVRLLASAATVFAAVALTGCTSTTAGTAVSSTHTPTVRVTSTPSTLGAPPTTTTTKPLPTSVPAAIQMIQSFWNSVDVKIDRFRYEAVSGAITCGSSRSETADAGFCDDGNVLRYRTDRFDKLMNNDTGTRAALVILAHEYGHAIQDYANQLQGSAGDRRIDGVAAAELSADCFSGIYSANSGIVDDSQQLVDAVKLTPIYQVNPRVDAFTNGVSHIAPQAAKKCLTEYEN